MALKEISGLMQITNGTASEWAQVNVPVPEGVLAYAIDTQEIRRGDGTNLYSDLDVFFDLSTTEEIKAFKDSFPDFASGANKLLIVNNTEDGFDLATVSIDDLATVEELTTALAGKSALVHTHTVSEVTGLNTAALRNVGTAVGEIPAIDASGKLPSSVVPAISADDDENENLLMYLLLMQLNADDQARLNLVDGFADEFETEESIDQAALANTTYNVDAYDMSPNGILQSNVLGAITASPMTLRALMRATYTGRINQDFRMSVRRTTEGQFSAIPMKENRLSGTSIKILSGDCSFLFDPTHGMAPNEIYSAYAANMTNISPDTSFANAFVAEGDDGGWYIRVGMPVIDNGILTLPNAADIIGGKLPTQFLGKHGSKYLIEMTIDSITTGSVNVYIAPSNADASHVNNWSNPISTPGTHYQVIEGDANSTIIGILSVTGTDAKISQINIWPIDELIENNVEEGIDLVYKIETSDNATATVHGITMMWK